MTAFTDVDRRTVLRGLGGLAVVGTLAGCSTDEGGDGGGDDGGGSGNSEVDDYLSDTSNYDGIEDHTGEGEVTVDVGVQANDGPFGFGPAAIRVDQGTTVVWEWTGDGSHNVVEEDGTFESELTGDEGFTFEHAFEETGTFLYVCVPHEPNGMKGAVVVE